MTAKQSSTEREAADWFARLNARTVTVTDLEAFRDWRSDPDHRQAYEAIERVWRAAGSLRADPQVRRLASDAIQRRRPVGSRRWAVGGSLAAASAAMAVGAFLWMEAQPDTWTTRVGETRSVPLADGSTVVLDTDSVVRVRLGGTARRLDLVRGQAQFIVAHDASRPFRVSAGDTAVTATGTRFAVRRDGLSVRITLVEGGVTVAEGGGANARRWALTPGQQLVTSPGVTRASEPLRRVNPEVVTSWTEGRLTFEATPLAAAVAEVNRYGGVPLRLSAAVDGARPVSGVFDITDKRSFIEAVASLYGLEARSEAEAVVLAPSPGAK